MSVLTEARQKRAGIIAKVGSIESALNSGNLNDFQNTTLSEALVLGLLKQNVKKYIVILGHGSTEIGEVLRIYEEAGALKSFCVRNEVSAAHAAMALRWVTGEKAAVITSIGPGAMQAFAGSLAAASDGVGVWFLFGDESSEDEGPNMQQIPGNQQHNFLKCFSTLGPAYSLHTPGALATALRRGSGAVDHPYRPGPFYLLLPLNTQPAIIENFNIAELPEESIHRIGSAAADGRYEEAAKAILESDRVVIKAGGGSRLCGPELLELMELSQGVVVTSPLVSGVVPYDHPHNMTVGGSKGSLSGNYAMENADLLVAIGSRFVCQADSSRTGYPGVKHVININGDPQTALHYNRTTALIGDTKSTLAMLNNVLKQSKKNRSTDWLKACEDKRKEWDDYRHQRYSNPVLYDEMWKQKVLTQPAVIKAASDWARKNNVVSFYDAGDVQANGFQIVEDDRIGRTFTETGASYMGFAASALVAAGIANKPFFGMAFTGDGSFMMNPQILIDGVFHKVHGCILLLDNRRMGAISSLQHAQYEKDYATYDFVPVDYLQMARSIQGLQAIDAGATIDGLKAALDSAHEYSGLSLVYVRVYFGHDPLGGMGVYGRWNVGNWVEKTQALRHQIGL